MIKTSSVDVTKASFNGISVIMPTYNQGSFIGIALASLFVQTFQKWELIIIDDGSTDYTEDIIIDYLKDARVRCLKNQRNKGLGYCLNLGMQYASYNFICYLPSDDIYYANHLSILYDTFQNNSNAILCYSGLFHNNSDNYVSGLSVNESLGLIPGRSLQLVQVIHKKTNIKWAERKDFVTSDLNKMFWNKLKKEGAFVKTNIISCEWVNHPLQRHKIIGEDYGGGLLSYKKYYNTKDLLKFYTDKGNCIDEQALLFESKSTQIEQKKRLKILIVGELGFNPERLLEFEQRGHWLFSLWISNPDIHNSVGPFSFGNIVNLDFEQLEAQIAEIKPDIIYALLNTQAVRLAHYVMSSNPTIPFIWHFKEGPFFCRNNGIWKELFELYYNADGRIYINQECKDWFNQFIGDKNRPSLIMDGDLPPRKWFSDTQSPLLSVQDGAIHTVMAGRPYGITPADLKVLSNYNIHLHLYGQFYQAKWKSWVDECLTLAGDYLHVHPHCEPENWTKEFSQYDAGWLHCFESRNNGELIRCNWDDLNYPARMSTLAVAGLPMIQKANRGHKVASEQLLKELEIGILFTSFDNLGMQLNNTVAIKKTRDICWNKRFTFSFDHHLDELLAFFQTVIANKQRNQ